MKRKIITQVGSLPLTDVKEAVEYSLKHDIPFLPELPKAGDSMLDYIKNPGKLSCLEEFKKHEFGTVKIQCVGPATLLLSGYRYAEAIERIYNHISAVMKELKAEKIILFLDEPALGQAGFNYKRMWNDLFSSINTDNVRVISGIHICGNMDWDLMFDSEIKIISFDASQFDLTKYSKYRSEKIISWGVKKAEDVRDFKEGDLLTLPCGMGSPLYKPEDCAKYLKNLENIAEEITKGK